MKSELKIIHLINELILKNSFMFDAHRAKQEKCLLIFLGKIYVSEWYNCVLYRYLEENNSDVDKIIYDFPLFFHWF